MFRQILLCWIVPSLTGAFTISEAKGASCENEHLDHGSKKTTRVCSNVDSVALRIVGGAAWDQDVNLVRDAMTNIVILGADTGTLTSSFMEKLRKPSVIAIVGTESE